MKWYFSFILQEVSQRYPQPIRLAGFLLPGIYLMPFKSELSVTFSGDRATLDWPLVYVHPKYGEIIVDQGFETDFASVPGWVLLPGIVPRSGRIKWASVVHDWIYRGHAGRRFTRKQADQILYDAAIEQGMSKWRATIAWIGVTVGGWVAWSL